jgi:hypothetical protein
MSELSTFFENAIIDAIKGTPVTFTGVAAYVALFDETSSPALLEAGTLTGEISGNDYARQLADLGDPTDGVASNATPIVFPTANGGDWGTVTYVALMNAVSGVEVLAYSALTAAKLVEDTDTFQILTGALEITLT